MGSLFVDPHQEPYKVWEDDGGALTQGDQMNGMTHTTREEIVLALMKAAVHASKVLVRPQVVPERAIRVGNFVTSLRRALPRGIRQGRYSHRDGLCQPHLWHDVLMLESEARHRSQVVACNRDCSITGRDLVSMVDEATSRLADESPIAIEAGLDRVQEDIKDQERLLQLIASVNAEAATIMDGFDELEEKMSKEAAETSL